MTFTQLAEKYPNIFIEALDSLDINRIAELADRGDAAEIGNIVFHVLEVAKCRKQDVTSLISATMTAEEEQEYPLIFLRNQAD